MRPPQQTPDQAEAMRIVRERAVKDSAEARPWVLQYFDSHWFRQNLDPSLQHYSAEQLLDMYTWEFVRLPLIHNAPKDDWDVDRCGITDDSPLNLTLANGNLLQLLASRGASSENTRVGPRLGPSHLLPSIRPSL